MFARHYGERPLHLIATIASLAVVAYALVQVGDRLEPLSFALFFAGAILAHDLIAFPLYSMLGVIAGRGGVAPRPIAEAVNYLRVPALLSAFLLIVWFPLIFRISAEKYEQVSGASAGGFLSRWLAVTAALFAVSGALYAFRQRRRGPDSGPATDPRGARSRR